MLKSAARLAFLDNEITRLRLGHTKDGSLSTGFQTLEPGSSPHGDQTIKWEKERASLLDYLAQNKAIISPLRRMPPEILCETFLLTLPSRVQEAAFASVHDSPWVLTQVCSRWRAIAISTPFLWSRVNIDYYKRAKYHLPNYPMAMIETQLQRATMLRIYFYGCTEFSVGPQLEMLRRLSEYSSCWTELNIGITEDMLPILVTLRNRLPALRKVWIQWEEDSARQRRMDCFQNAPSLRDITLFNDTPYAVRVLVPARQLTRYDADGPWDMHRAVLTSAQSLVEARIETNLFGVPADPGQIIELLHLERLFVSRTEVLGYLKTPALAKLALELGTAHAVRPQLDPFVVRSSCTIRRLSLRFPHPHGVGQIREILEKYTSITSVAILTPKPNTVISHLTIPKTAHDAGVGPQLSEIEIGTPTFLDWAGFVGMLESRWKVKGCALQFAAVGVDNSPSSAALTRLDALRKDGLDVSLLEKDDALEAMRAWVHIVAWN
jgi:hypothetical protein